MRKRTSDSSLRIERKSGCKRKQMGQGISTAVLDEVLGGGGFFVWMMRKI